MGKIQSGLDNVDLLSSSMPNEVSRLADSLVGVRLLRYKANFKTKFIKLSKWEVKVGMSNCDREKTINPIYYWHLQFLSFVLKNHR
jgi:hypothetical protein